MSKRLNASERARFRRYAANISLTGEVPDDPKRRLSRYDATPAEPALGSLAERLAILVVRHGGRLRVGKPSAEELASVVRYDVIPGPRGGFVEQLLPLAA